VENAARPFCSLRCRNADLGAWSSAEYRLAAQQPLEIDAPDQNVGSAH
jgi:endogenous inhibitor of DNA gyrase (YacG/DUF329 family)